MPNLEPFGLGSISIMCLLASLMIASVVGSTVSKRVAVTDAPDDPRPASIAVDTYPLVSPQPSDSPIWQASVASRI